MRLCWTAGFRLCYMSGALGPPRLSTDVMLQPWLLPGVNPDRMKARLLTLKLLLATVGAVTVGWYAIASISLSGLSPSNWNAADVIRQHCPVHLVRPEWIKGTDQGDMLFAWAVTETKARLALVCALWLIAVGVLVWRALPRRQHEQTSVRRQKLGS